jgi:pre-mRNA-splicing factor 38A
MAGSYHADRYKTAIKGGNPVFLIEKITREKILLHPFWKEHCFGLNVDTLLEKAVDLEYVGGTYGGFRKPSPFICLALKMLELTPTQDIVLEYLRQPDFKYVTALAAFYVRLTMGNVEVYTFLEPLLSDFRKLRLRATNGKFSLIRMDEWAEMLMRDRTVADTALPHLTDRAVLEASGQIQRRISPLQDELDRMLEDAVEGEEEKEEEEEEVGVGGVGGSLSNKRKAEEPPPGHEDSKKKKLVIKGLKLKGQKEEPPAPKSQPKNAAQDQEGSMSIEETNKLRASLGLKPLK